MPQSTGLEADGPTISGPLCPLLSGVKPPGSVNQAICSSPYTPKCSSEMARIRPCAGPPCWSSQRVSAEGVAVGAGWGGVWGWHRPLGTHLLRPSCHAEPAGGGEWLEGSLLCFCSSTEPQQDGGPRSDRGLAGCHALSGWTDDKYSAEHCVSPAWSTQTSGTGPSVMRFVQAMQMGRWSCAGVERRLRSAPEGHVVKTVGPL